MKFPTLLYTIITTFTLLVAADQENYNTANGVSGNVDRRYRYAMREEWHANTIAERCYMGFSHVRLVVGKFSGQDFQAEAFEMVSDGHHNTHGAFFGVTDADRDTNWLANRYIKVHEDDGRAEVLRVSNPNNYIWLGRIRNGVTNDHIQSLGRCSIST